MTERSVSKTRKLTAAAVLAAAAYLLAFLEFPVPLTPTFARMDLSDLPALIGAFAFGPVTGVMIELVKNLLGLMTSSTGGVGELANFLMERLMFSQQGWCIGTTKQREWPSPEELQEA